MSTTVLTKHISNSKEKKVGKGDRISSIELRIERHIKSNLGLQND